MLEEAQVSCSMMQQVVKGEQPPIGGYGAGSVCAPSFSFSGLGSYM